MSHDPSVGHSTSDERREASSAGQRTVLIAGVLVLGVTVIGAIGFISGIGPFRASGDPAAGSDGPALVVSSGCPWRFTLPDFFGEPTPRPQPDDVDPWAAHAMDHRDDVGRCFEYSCPPGGTTNPIWGTGVYTDDSSICTAAVHAGAITVGQGGTVQILIRPGQASYAATSQHGITSEAWPAWEGSFVIAGR